MRGLLQRISKFFSDIFPLHTSSEVEALRESLAKAEQDSWVKQLAIDHYMDRCKALHSRNQRLAKTNNEFFRDNIHTRDENRRLHQQVSMLELELESIWKETTKSLRHLPIRGDVSMTTDSFFGQHLRVDVKPLSFAMNVTAPLDSSPRFIDYLAREVGAAYRQAVEASVKQSLQSIIKR